jgi:DNA adenine methylase
MTAYHGGKQRGGKVIANAIYDISMEIEDEYDFTIKGYCEPFCGMLGVYKHMPKLFDESHPKLKYKAGDINESVIKMWKASQKGWVPPSKCTEKKYMNLKDSKSSALKGFIGHAYGFGGIYFGAFRSNYHKYKDNKTSAKNVTKIAKELSSVKFYQPCKYTKFSNLKGHVIYCDPPYAKYNRYYDEKMNRRVFDTEKFWDWCRKMSKDNIVFISEYKAPSDFEVLFNKSKTHNYGKTTGKNSEGLFVTY